MSNQGGVDHKARILAMWDNRDAFGMVWQTIDEFVRCYNQNYRKFETGYRNIAL